MPIAGITANADVLGGLSLVWGVTPVPATDGVELDAAIGAARGTGLLADGDLVVVVFGASGPRAGSTDSVRVLRV